MVGNDIRELNNNKADKHEIHTLNSKVDSLEHTLRTLRSDFDGLCSKCQELETNQIRMQEVIERLEKSGETPA